MPDFIEHCHRISHLTREAESDLRISLKYKTVKKGQIINKEGQVCRQFYHIDSGLVKHYYQQKNRTFIIQFFSDGNFFTVLDSFIKQSPALFNTVALEETQLSYLNYKEFEKLCRDHHCFQTFISRIYAKAGVANLKRIKDMFDSDASELYKNFLIERGHIVERISLGDIASYLGISQISLSRIRAKK